MKILLSLDLSTTCTGWSTFDIATNKLITYGIIKPGSKFNGVAIAKLKYPEQQLTKMIDISLKIKQLIAEHSPSRIVIEEIAGSRQRLGQKVLDGLHWIILFHCPEMIPISEYYDVTGAEGWRTNLGLRLSEADKVNNKEAKKINAKLGRGVSKLPVVGPKDLACRHANRTFGLALDPQENQFDADIGDSVSMGDAYLKYRCPRE